MTAVTVVRNDGTDEGGFRSPRPRRRPAEPAPPSPRRVRKAAIMISMLCLLLVLLGAVNSVVSKIRSKALGRFNYFSALFNAVVYALVYGLIMAGGLFAGFIAPDGLKYLITPRNQYIGTGRGARREDRTVMQSDVDSNTPRCGYSFSPCAVIVSACSSVCSAIGNAGNYKYLCLCGVLDGWGNLLGFIGQPYISGPLYSLMTQTIVPFTAIVSVIALHRRYTLRQVTALLVVFTGFLVAWLPMYLETTVPVPPPVHTSLTYGKLSSATIPHSEVPYSISHGPHPNYGSYSTAYLSSKNRELHSLGVSDPGRINLGGTSDNGGGGRIDSSTNSTRSTDSTNTKTGSVGSPPECLTTVSVCVFAFVCAISTLPTAISFALKEKVMLEYKQYVLSSTTRGESNEASNSSMGENTRNRYDGPNNDRCIVDTGKNYNDNNNHNNNRNDNHNNNHNENHNNNHNNYHNYNHNENHNNNHNNYHNNNQNNDHNNHYSDNNNHYSNNNNHNSNRNENYITQPLITPPSDVTAVDPPPLNVAVVCLVTSLFQLLSVPFSLPLNILLGQTDGSSLQEYVQEGFDCFRGVYTMPNTFIKTIQSSGVTSLASLGSTGSSCAPGGGGSVPICVYALPSYLFYIVVNLTYNLTLIALVRSGSALLAFVSLKAVLPLSILLFWAVPWPLLDQNDVQLAPDTFLSLFIIVCGIGFFEWERQGTMKQFHGLQPPCFYPLKCCQGDDEVGSSEDSLQGSVIGDLEEDGQEASEGPLEGRVEGRGEGREEGRGEGSPTSRSVSTPRYPPRSIRSVHSDFTDSPSEARHCSGKLHALTVCRPF